MPPNRPPSIPDPILDLARLTAADEIAPLPHPGRPTLGARWGRMLHGGVARICLRQLRLRRAKAATRTFPAEDSASEGLRLLRRTLAGFRPSELAFILPEDSARAVWEISDGDDGLVWADTIQRQLEETCGPFTDEEIEAWCNLDATIGDLAALLDKILSENRPLPSPRPSLFARLFVWKTKPSPSASCRGRAVGSPGGSGAQPPSLASLPPSLSPFVSFVPFVAKKSPPSKPLRLRLSASLREFPSRFPIRFFRRPLFTLHFSLFTSSL